MGDINFQKTNIDGHPNSAIINLSGALDAFAAPDLEKDFFNCIDNENILNFLIDCDNLDYISSAGIGVFMSVLKELSEQNGKIIFFKMPEKIFDVFKLLGFDKLFKIESNLEDALNLL